MGQRAKLNLLPQKRLVEILKRNNITISTSEEFFTEVDRAAVSEHRDTTTFAAELFVWAFKNVYAGVGDLRKVLRLQRKDFVSVPTNAELGEAVASTNALDRNTEDKSRARPGRPASRKQEPHRTEAKKGNYIDDSRSFD